MISRWTVIGFLAANLIMEVASLVDARKRERAWELATKHLAETERAKADGASTVSD